VIVIDGLNVARAASYTGACLSSACATANEAVETPIGHAQALASAIDHFLSQGFEVHAILPVWALDGGRRTLVGGDVLRPYVQGEVVHLSPTGTNDDEFILQLARCRDAYILTNDLFRDHIAQGSVPKAWVAARRVSYMYVHRQILTVMPTVMPTAPPQTSRVMPTAPPQTSRVDAAGPKRYRPNAAICKRRMPARHGNRPGSVRAIHMPMRPVNVVP